MHFATSLLLLLVTMPVTPAHSAELSQASHLPITLSTSVAVGIAGRNDKQSTLLEHADGSFDLIYRSGKGTDIEDLQLYRIKSPDGVSLDAPHRLRLLDRPIVTSADFVTVDERTWMYFVSGETLRGPPEIWRAPVSAEGFGNPESLPAIADLSRMTGWPQWVEYKEGVSLSFRNRRSRPYWGLSATGTAWQPRQLEDVSAAYVRVVPMPGGGWLLTHQHPTAKGNILTYAQFSQDGESWSAPEAVSLPQARHWPDVHDAFALPRSDHGIDLYYVYPGPKKHTRGGFNLYRRALLGPGNVGPEQALTEPEDFDPYSVSAHRLRNGGVLLTFSNILDSDNRGVSEAQLHIAKLAGDAPIAPMGSADAHSK